MASYVPKQEVLKSLYYKLAEGKPIVIAGAGTDLAA